MPFWHLFLDHHLTTHHSNIASCLLKCDHERPPLTYYVADYTSNCCCCDSIQLPRKLSRASVSSIHPASLKLVHLMNCTIALLTTLRPNAWANSSECPMQTPVHLEKEFQLWFEISSGTFMTTLQTCNESCTLKVDMNTLLLTWCSKVINKTLFAKATSPRNQSSSLHINLLSTCSSTLNIWFSVVHTIHHQPILIVLQSRGAP